MGRCSVRALVAAAALLFAWSAGAQISVSVGDKKSAGAGKSSSAEASAFARAWRRMPPPDIYVSDLAISPGGDVYATGSGGLFRWNKVKFEWEIVTAAFKPRRIAVSRRRGGEDLIYGVASTLDGDWLFSSGKELVWKASARASDVAVDGKGLPVIVDPSGTILRWGAKGGWVPVPVAGKASRIAVSADDSIWAVTEEGLIVRSDGKPVEQVPGGARDIASRGNTMVAASASGQLQRWNERGKRWEGETFAPPDVAVMVVAPNGDGWAATSRGIIFTQAPVRAPKKNEPLIAQQPVGTGVKFNRPGKSASGGGTRVAGRLGQRAARAGGALVAVELPGAKTDPAPFVFVDTNATGTYLSIGPEGSIFERTLGNTLARWSNQRNAFVAFPGTVVRIAVDRGGNLWGLNGSGAIYRHNGTDWRQIAGTASDLAIAVNGTIMIIDENRLLRRFVPERSLFELLPGPVSGLTQIALAPDGVPWGLRGNTIVRCAAVPCEAFLEVGARSLSIGPDGSIFIVTNTDPAQLRRFNAEARRFDEIIPLPQPHLPASVAVGPGGRPWVVTAQNRVLRTNLFPRDEAADQGTINSTATATTAAPLSAIGGTGPTVAVVGSFGGFQFSKTMTFIGLSVAPPCANILNFGIGHDGTVMVVCDPPPGQRLLRLSSDFKTFTQLTTVPTSEINHVDVDSEGRIWLTDAAINGRIYRETAKGSNAYQTIQVNVPAVITPPPHNRALAIANDDTVYFIDSGGNLYRKPKDSSVFTKMLNGTFDHVAVGGQNDLWLIDGLTFGLFQLVNGQLVARQAVANPSIIDVAGGPDGSIYITEANMDSLPTPTIHMYKWIGPSLRFDRINTVEPFRMQVDRTGRPWYFETVNITTLFRAK